jgi:hypothetical protein
MNGKWQIRTLVAVASFVLAAAAGWADEIRLGSLEGNNAVFTGASAMTIIDWSRPAQSSGTVNTASVAWTGASTPCDNIFYVRFYAIPSNALFTVMTAERGPFRAVNGINTVALEPPVAVTSDNYIGIRRGEGAETCGQPYGTFTRDPGRGLSTSADFKGGMLTLLSPVANYRLQAQASSAASVRVSTLPGVASAAGALGSFFRTSLVLANPGALEIRGKLRMRLAGRAGTDADPTLDYVIPPNGTIRYADVVAAMGQSGLGSLDVLTTASPTPIASATVFNDGATGTAGFSEEAVPNAPNYLSVANVFIPSDLTNFRLNIGIRVFTPGNLQVDIYDANGSRQASFIKTKYTEADFFEQVPASAFVDNNALPLGGKIVVSAFSKQFIVYGAVTDNRTQDPSMRIGSD